ncbi:1-acyl-sn-glycerol-3-phosphate acyltransferase [bacterium AH-315-N03]|nr:1-acyl-sn-glycerol-3-phosphate acyltransferase [bacterium AH-315-N03]
MPRWLRTALTISAFAMFFFVTATLGAFALPLLFVFRSRFGDPRTFTRMLNSKMRLFGGFLQDAGLLSYWPLVLPEGYENRPLLVISNHPTLLDVVLTMSSLPQLCCVASAARWESWLMGFMLKRTTFVPGPGLKTDDPLETEIAFIGRMEAKLREGEQLLVFPEGTRSTATELRRFGRGAIEAAIRAEVPILPLYIAVDPPFLMKGQHFTAPEMTPIYRFEWFEPIDTAGHDLDSKKLTKELAARYQLHFDELLTARVANSASPRAA